MLPPIALRTMVSWEQAGSVDEAFRLNATPRCRRYEHLGLGYEASEDHLFCSIADGRRCRFLCATLVSGSSWGPPPRAFPWRDPYLLRSRLEPVESRALGARLPRRQLRLVVARRRDVVLLSGPCISVSRPVRAFRCGRQTGGTAMVPAASAGAVLVPLRLAGWLLPVCSVLSRGMESGAGEPSCASRGRSTFAATCPMKRRQREAFAA